MKLFISILVCIQISFFATAQNNAPSTLNILGTFSADSLRAAPFAGWFVKNYDEYRPDSSTVAGLKKQVMKDIRIQVFLGTWCGDSKREVPRFLKSLHDANFPAAQLQLIGVGASDSLYKQSPAGEEKGLGIFRVPTIIVYKKGIEINRINEYPSLSLEKDLLKILTGQPVPPNYASFSTLRTWLSDGSLLDANISSRSLAQQLKPLLSSENELNSVGYLLLGQQQKKQALKVFQVNSVLFPESANVSSSLGEGYYETGEYSLAVKLLEKSLEQNKDPQAVKGILSVLYKAKEKAGH
jgi:tetratricopeptide (TPR) repeat protein